MAIDFFAHFSSVIYVKIHRAGWLAGFAQNKTFCLEAKLGKMRSVSLEFGMCKPNQVIFSLTLLPLAF